MGSGRALASERASIPTLTLARCWSTSTASRSHASTCPPPRAPPRAGRRGARFAVRRKAACSGRARRRRPSATTICPLGAESRSLSFRTTPPAANTRRHKGILCTCVLSARAVHTRVLCTCIALKPPTKILELEKVRPFSPPALGILGLGVTSPRRAHHAGGGSHCDQRSHQAH